jgi:hypothetical protein
MDPNAQEQPYAVSAISLSATGNASGGDDRERKLDTTSAGGDEITPPSRDDVRVEATSTANDAPPDDIVVATDPVTYTTNMGVDEKTAAGELDGHPPSQPTADETTPTTERMDIEEPFVHLQNTEETTEPKILGDNNIVESADDRERDIAAAAIIPHGRTAATSNAAGMDIDKPTVDVETTEQSSETAINSGTDKEKASEQDVSVPRAWTSETSDEGKREKAKNVAQSSTTNSINTGTEPPSNGVEQKAVPVTAKDDSQKEATEKGGSGAVANNAIDSKPNPPSLKKVLMSTGSQKVVNAFKLTDPKDSMMFLDIANQLKADGCPPGNPCDVPSAILTSLLKGLSHTPAYKLGGTFEGGLRELAVNFAIFQADALASGSASVTMVQVAQYCADLLKKWESKHGSKLLNNMFHYFLDYSTAVKSSPQMGATSTSHLKPFLKLLTKTINNICCNTQHCLEDLMDFEYIWEATKFAHPMFIDEEGVSKNQGTNGNGKRPVSPMSHSASEKYQVVKEFAWTLARTIQLAKSIDKEDLSSYRNTNRRNHVTESAACIDLVVAAVKLDIKGREWSEQIAKKVKQETGVLVWSKGDHDNASREQLRKDVLHAANEVLVAVSPRKVYTPLARHELVGAGTYVSATALPWIDVKYSKYMSVTPSSLLMPSIATHSQREGVLSKLNSEYFKIISFKVERELKTLLLTSPNSKDHAQVNESSLKVGCTIGNLQQAIFVESIKDFFSFANVHRKMLAPINQRMSNYDVKGIVYKTQATVTGVAKPPPRKLPTPTNATPSFEMRNQNTIYIKGLQSPQVTESEQKEVTSWSDEILGLVLSTESIKPSTGLLELLGEPSLLKRMSWKEVLRPVLNYSIAVVAKSCLSGGKDCDYASVYTLSKEDLSFNVLPNTKQSNEAMPGAVLFLYFYALECILRSDRAERNGRPNPALSINEQFHSSLFSLCSFCLRRATNQKDTSFEIQDIGSCPVVYFKLIDSLIHSMKAGSESLTIEVMAMPTFIIRTLRQVQDMLIGSLWMMNSDGIARDIGSNFIEMINKLRERPSTWPLANLRKMCSIDDSMSVDPTSPMNSKEYTFVSYMMNNLLSIIKRRVQALCNVLSLPNSTAVHDKTMMVFTTMLCYRIDLFFDRHPDQIMLCSMYAACAKMKLAPEIDFTKINDAYAETNKHELSPHVVHKILFQIKFSSDNDGIGDIISFYNVSLNCNFYLSNIGTPI